MSDVKEMQIPEGYMMDHRGAFVPVEIVKDVDKMRDALVQEIVRGAVHMSEALSEFKRKAMEDVLAFVALAGEKYGVKMGGQKGNISLVSFDGKYKVLRSINEYVSFDERLEAAKILLDECLENWTEGAEDKLKKVVNFAFKVDSAGKLSTQRIMGLLKVDITDPLWRKAMEAITESITVSGSKAYIRIYRRVDDTDKYEQINLDMAAL
jgi:hypothetical protein